MSSTHSRYQYFCFRLFGLQCEDAEAPEQFLFFDATILSGAQARLLCVAPHEGLNYVLPDESHYLVVRRPSKVQIERNSVQFKLVEQRAMEVIAGISVPLLAYSNFASSPALATEIHQSRVNSIVHLHAGGVMLANEYVRSLHIAIPDHRFTRSELLDLLHREPYHWLTDVLLFGNDSRKLFQTIRSSVVALYTGINQPTPTFQFFGCYVALEVLLNSGKSENVMKRTKLLVGDQNYQDYRAGEAITSETANSMRVDSPLRLDQIRHKIAHEGGLATAENVFYLVRLATNALLASAYYCRHFETKAQFCEHLDYVRQVRSQPSSRDIFSISSYWSSMWTERCLWDYNFAHLVFFFGLHKREVDHATFRVNAASALAILSEVKGFERSAGFNGLAKAMYVLEIPFQSSEEAWLFIDSHRLEIDPTLDWFR